MVGQLERSPTTGKRHVQAYVIFVRPQQLSAVKRLFGTAHLEISRGSPQDNKTYCTKAETRVATDDGGFQFEVTCANWDHCLFHNHYLYVHGTALDAINAVRSDDN